MKILIESGNEAVRRKNLSPEKGRNNAMKMMMNTRYLSVTSVWR